MLFRHAPPKSPCLILRLWRGESRIVFPMAVIYSIVLIISLLGIYYFKGLAYLLDAFHIYPDTYIIIGLGLGGGCGVVAVSIISAYLFKRVKDLQQEFTLILGRLSSFEIIVVALSSGIAEEVLFRGLLQPYLGLAITSVIFGMLHFPVKRVYIIWTVFAVGMGFMLGWFYELTGSLLTPIITHVLVNAINLFRLEDDFPIALHTECPPDIHL
ncbi:MAG: CPBP family intramembrane metalloprotease [Planctomycetes bacterium]|nr:CPBP family intramembrane metalloprotease [Planctomycetota bacterium]